MIYKNLVLQETIPFEYPERERNSFFVRKYERMFSHLDLSAIDRYSYGVGCKGYDTHSMLKALIFHNTEGFRSIPQLIDILRSMPYFSRYVLGFADSIPDNSTFYRFIKALDPEVLRKLLAQTVKTRRHGNQPRLIAIDSKAIKANTSQNNPKRFIRNLSDKTTPPERNEEATLGWFSASNDVNTGKKTTVFFWGYRLHLIVDALSGDPLTWRLEKNNLKDSEVAPRLYCKLVELWPELYRSGLRQVADAGYYARDVFKAFHLLYDGKSCIPMNPRNSKLREIEKPVCAKELPMRYQGTWKDEDKGCFRVKFGCPAKKAPCPHRKTKYGCTRYFQVREPYPGEVPRLSKTFRRHYPKRQAVERVNGTLQMVGLESPGCFSMRGIENMLGFALIGRALTLP
jgi:hypothetical protein